MARDGIYDIGFARYRSSVNPFSLDPGSDAAKALWSGMAELQLAWPFTALTVGESLDEFVTRWLTWFADAALGKLQHPSSMPERPPNGSWRKN